MISFKGKIYLILLLGFLFTTKTVFPQTEYSAKDGWVIGYNKNRFNNRPLYLPVQSTFILTGDNPVMRFVSDRYLYGTLYFTYENQRVNKSFHEFDSITSLYKGGVMKWILQDSDLPELQIELEILPTSNDYLGSIIKIKTSGRSKGDKLQVIYGEKRDFGKRLSWALDVMGHPEIMKWGIDEDFKKDGSLTLSSGSEHYVKVIMTDEHNITLKDSDRSCYKVSSKEIETFMSRLKINTPDEFLNAAAMASLKAIDGSWSEPVFLHGCMQWNNRYPGWRTIFGGTMYGWHDRVQKEAAFYIESQIKDSDNTEALADEQYMLTKQHANSLYYGKGRISKDQSFYNMQTQLFDQLIEEYRWNNSKEYVELLRPALELHLNWQASCFDPDGDGLYESYINTWPTDSQWYNGGGTAEETSYAYRGHLAAYDMAVAAGDSLSACHHKYMLDKIKNGFQKLLWIKDKGYSGAYKEQGGYERIHENPWLYSIFLPVDAGLTSDIQNIESMYYTEWALQNDAVEGEGRMVWTSNWMPAVWSVRELWPGDNFHLAYAYMKSGLATDGWEILKGTMLNMAYNHTVPGNLGGKQGGIDFGDCIHPFARTLVSGLFGYMPDYPKGKVVFEPSFPDKWDFASIELPDFKFDFKHDDGKVNYKLELAKPAEMEVRIPLICSKIKQILVNGKPAKYETKAMPGKTMLIVNTRKSAKSDIEIKYIEDHGISETIITQGDVYSEKNIKFDGEVEAIYDPQGILSFYSLEGNNANIKFNGNSGYHSIIAKIIVDMVPRYQIVRIKLVDKNKEIFDDRINMKGVALKDFDWKLVDLSESFNDDVRNIYKQKYLSPRPNTVSVRIGTDGYSPWTFPHWKSTAPDIMLDGVDKMYKDGILNTPQGVPFNWNTDGRNIAFVSLWDNYPDAIEIPINKEGKAACFLVCGSTNMMQCHISNAELTIVYEDGYSDVIELIPPLNYWNLCPIQPKPAAAGQISRAYYDSEIDRFSMPKNFPHTVSLGKNCTAMLLPRMLREGVVIDKIKLKCKSQEVVVGLMGISISK